MPRTVPAGLLTEIQSDSPRLAWCWRIERLDGAVHRFTSHDQDLELAGQTYEAKGGIDPSTLSSEIGVSVDGLEMAGLLSSDTITDEDVLAGRFDGATCEVMIVPWADPSAGAITLLKGPLGEARLAEGRYVIEARGLLQAASAKVGKICGGSCRVKEFGDAECGIDTAPLTFAATVTQVTSTRLFRCSSLIGRSEYFEFGKCSMTSGDNSGLARGVKGFDDSNGEIELFEAFRLPVQVGDTLTLRAGCDRSKARCLAYGNVVNFRGEPYMPGPDAALRSPGQ